MSTRLSGAGRSVLIRQQGLEQGAWHWRFPRGVCQDRGQVTKLSPHLERLVDDSHLAPSCCFFMEFVPL